MALEYKLLPGDYQSSAFDTRTSICLLCDRTFDLSYKLHVPRTKVDKLRQHLLIDHKFVISDIGEVIDLGGYLEFWRQKFALTTDLKRFCAVIRTNSSPNDCEESQDYFMLCPDVLPEDAFLREDLKTARLNRLLSIIESERSQSNFTRPCLFCRKELSGKRKAYFEHLRQSHNFSFGNPDNLIFTDEFLDMIDEKLNRRVCLYCENTYKDWNALKEHMRKKFHKHLNPHNKEYDKFYVNNYLKQQQTWKLALHEKSLDANQKDAPNDSDEDENWDDWVQAEEEPLKLLCLFCPDHFGSLDRFRAHMLNQHCIEFDAILKYSFYLQVKLVNYVRNCQLMAKCVNCDQKFDDNQKLNEHYLTNAHLQWPSNEQFDRAEYLLPSLQDDHVLRILVDWEQSDESAPVIPESDTYTSNHLIDYDLLKELV